jgi:hypothetical protein
MKKFLENINSRQLIFIGFVVIFIFNLPYIILWENSWFNFGYDSLDSNVVWFKLLVESGKIFSQNNTIIEPALSGLPRLAFPDEFSIELWLYYFLSPVSAYIANIILIQAFAFLGMFLLLRKIKRNGSVYLIFTIALVYSMLPFWPHAGLSVAGLPLIYYGYLQLNTKPFESYLILFVYVFYSSFVITGLFLIAVLFLLILYHWIKNKELNKQGLIYVVVMLFLFLATNYRLFVSVFVDHFISHRVDVVFIQRLFSDSVSMFIALLVKEYGHNFIGKTTIVIIVLGYLIIEFFWKRKEFKKNAILFNVILLIITLSFLSALFRNTAFRDFYISIIPFLNTIQLQRFYWLLPPLFYVLLFLVLDKFIVKKKGVYIVSLILLFQFAYVASRNATYRQVLKTKILGRETERITFRKFYSPDLYAEINQYIDKPQNSYRIASIGLQPAAALYNGFYTIDGYFPNYPREYKYRFYDIIKDELDKSKSISEYDTFIYDDSIANAPVNATKQSAYDTFVYNGSICIIFSDEVINRRNGKRFIIPVVYKNESFGISNLDINTKKMLDLNCQYLFSAVSIENSSSIGLIFEKYFENEHSPWGIYLYSINEN